ncbi:MAG: hypothetical protein BZY83_06600 [SAR202 cluster bacterium Casp-Chloro-G2]|nr:MAG: hypothetical protein BZY83_06600 [SAR202 cluster bacterium Casp-Chloro-G2]
MFDLRFLVAAIDGCSESEGTIARLLASGSPPQNIQMFYAHRRSLHPDPIGLPFGRLHLMFQYLEDLLELDSSTAHDYEEHMKAGRHILVANVYSENDSKKVAAILGQGHTHDGRVLCFGHTGRLPQLRLD